MMIRNFLACGYCQARLDAYLDDTLNPRARRRVARHIDSCPSCYRVYVQRRELRRELQNEVPLVGRDHEPDFGRMWAAIRADLPRPKPRYAQFQLGLVALLLLLVMMVPFMMGNHELARALPPQPQPHEESAAQTAESTEPVAVATVAATSEINTEYAVPPTQPEPNGSH